MKELQQFASSPMGFTFCIIAALLFVMMAMIANDICRSIHNRNRTKNLLDSSTPNADDSYYTTKKIISTTTPDGITKFYK